ncbi:carcinoembryonic antigen-related cell adhesion molecule 2-like isoform X2 [Labrus mixtus]|uniref:carcinoembryonic antigen-related cell adhesion molecule 2-like isoform X2 n=1 Tax=Labrus mixtus TaxID=508554 RepID=UPI0029BFC56D|nr:carcinoembryonic antigen-related cell adhesion molecule 2-like isoform X2 [Labrus mixtus]
METAAIAVIILGIFSGFTDGVGVLPDLLNAAVGETVRFTTTLSPTEKPFSSVAWWFGDREIITSNSVTAIYTDYESRITYFPSTGSLELRILALSDSGEYRVTIIPYGETAKYGSTRLQVYEPVSNIMVTDRGTDLVEFSSIYLSCSSSGSSLFFRWWNDTSEVITSDRVQLTDGGSTLTITNVIRCDQGPYRCLVGNPVSNGSSGLINLSISFGPESTSLKLFPSQEYFAEGSDIIMSCSADSRPAALFYWFFDGGKLPDTGPEFTLMNNHVDQSGNYSCQAFNSKTEKYQTSQSSVISVLERISGAFVTSSTNLMIEENYANLTCDAAGSVFTRQWMDQKMFKSKAQGRSISVTTSR